MTTRDRPKKRLLVFVVAYFAESTLKAVLERIPTEVLEEFHTEVLIIDDGSEDRTFEIGAAYRDAHPEMKLTVLRNEYNQGYGGNQKLGYHFAIQEGFDLVVLLHGDAQYAPEELPRLARPVANGDADAVFGSRMLVEGAALKGGMPFYKFIGNKILTHTQNFLLGTNLSEFHSGYRVYSVDMLKRLPFRLNSNDFHFDTEIIIQLVNAKGRILELPIPTYYGDEICRVNGMKYAKDVLVATAKNTAHKAGIFYQRRYDVSTDDQHYRVKLGYPSSHTAALEAIPDGAKVLDIGGGPVELARELVRRGSQVCVVAPVESVHRDPGITTQVRDLEESPGVDVRGYSHLLLLDIIEHMENPEAFLDSLRRQFTYDTQTIVLTTPNIAFITQRLQLLLGQFNYGKAGILDQTHRRLFTFRGVRDLLRDAGFQVKEVRGIPAPFPKVLGNGVLGRTAIQANQALIRISRTLFSYQIFVEAQGTPDVVFLLNDAKARLRERAAQSASSPKPDSPIRLRQPAG
jgi:glycosyltransferase involved in cell wall biosynthesis